MITFLDPRGRSPEEPAGADVQTLAPRRSGAELRSVALVDNCKPGAADLLKTAGRLLHHEFGVEVRTIRKLGRSGSSGPLEPGQLQGEAIGAVIHALGD